MAGAKKPRKKKATQNPAQSKRRESIREQKELSEHATKAVDTCKEMIEHFDTAVQSVYPNLTGKEIEEWETIRDRALEDIGVFHEDIKRVNEEVTTQIDKAYKGDKINEKEVVELFGKVLGFADISENVVNYMSNTEATLQEFVEEVNGKLKEVDVQVGENNGQ